MIKPLTSFRFFAALGVFMLHARFGGYFKEGHIAVTFFFILSGFILTYSYFDKLKELNQLSLKKYYASRISRIYPLHILTFCMFIPVITIKVIVGIESIQGVLGKGVLNIFLLQSYIPIQKVYYSPWNGISWSISDEMFFYLLFPIVCWLLAKLNIAQSVVKLSILLAFFWILPVFIIQSLGDIVHQEYFFYILPPFRFFDFLVGVLLGRIFVNVKKYKNPVLLTVFELISLLGLTAAVATSSHWSTAMRYSMIYLPFMALIIIVFAYQGGLISKMLSHKYLVYLGEISFTFFMLAGPIMYYVMKVFHGIYTVALISFVVTLIASMIIHKRFEVPLRNIVVARLLSRKKFRVKHITQKATANQEII